MQASLPLFGSIFTNGLSMLAAGILIMALPWAYLSAGGSATGAGFMAAALHFPLALGLLLGGRLVDAYGPRPVLMATNFATLLLAAAGAALAYYSPSWIVVVLCALANLAGAPGGVAQDSRVPELARLARMPLERANGLRDIAGNIGQLGGPAGGVLLVESAGVPGALGVAAALLAVIALVDAWLFPAFRQRKRAATSASAKRKAAGQGGFSLLWRDSALRTVAGLGVLLVSVFFSLDEVLAPNLAVSSGMGGNALAMFLATVGMCALAGTGLFTLYGNRLKGRLVLLAGIFLAAAGFVVLSVAPPQWGFHLAPVLIGFGIGPLWPTVVTFIHRRVPVSQRGGVIGGLAGVALMAQPVAALVAGPAVDVMGAQGLLWLVTGLVVTVALAAPALPGLHALNAGTHKARRKNHE